MPAQARRVLVTGAAGGMSRGITGQLAAAGHHIICVDLDQARVRSVAETLIEAGGSASWHACDLSEPDAIDALVRDVGDVEGVVNAAGVLDRKPIDQLDTDTFERVIGVNLRASVGVIRAFLPGMREAGWGRIVNITSIAASHGYPYAAYAASKAAVKHFGMSLVSDLRGTGITVNSISPGVVDTPMVIEAVRERVARRVPTGALVTPEEIGDAVVFLISDSGRNITGADLVIDGGATQLLAFFED